MTISKIKSNGLQARELAGVRGPRVKREDHHVDDDRAQHDVHGYGKGL